MVGVSLLGTVSPLSSINSFACAAIEAINPADDAFAIPRAVFIF
jgi:hypothetical protein